jgi:excisionase family DNA binding protein
MPDLPRYLTTSQVAEMLSVTGDKVVDLIHSGQLPAINVALHKGGKARWRIAAAELEAFLNSRRTGPPTPRAPRRKERSPMTQYY